ncbi:MAG: hypothetical protein C4560_05230 [Nitrospiraceae bacterium]|nr:MAG: hypothetical protein C4560_05230 [Nitrospiraceae bacterium]
MDKKKRKTSDINLIASSIVSQATGQLVKPTDNLFDSEIVQKAIAEGKDPLAVLLGQRGGLKGGKARAESLSAKKRKEIAQKAAKARWSSK